MQPQLDVRILSSFLIHLDHQIQVAGLAYRNQVQQFYPAYSPFAGTYTYTTPLKPLCNDVSVPGAKVISGLWLGNSYITIGQSGLQAINHYKGAAYFTGTPIPQNIPVSGDGAIKEINVKITDQIDWKLLFETEYISPQGYIAPSGTGLPIDSEMTPVLFVRYKGGENKPFGFSKLDNQTIYVRTIAVCDTEYQKISLVNILKNFNMRTIPIVMSTPFNAVGDFTGVNYDYTKLSYDPGFTPIVMSVKAIDVPIQGEYRNILRNMAIVDFELSTIAKS